MIMYVLLCGFMGRYFIVFSAARAAAIRITRLELHAFLGALIGLP